MFTVYSITKGGRHGGEIHVPAGCVVENVNDKSTGELHNFYLLSNLKGSHYLCPSEVFSVKPEGGMLGDLQIMEGNNTKFMHNEIHCVADYQEHSVCRYPDSFIEHISEVCYTPAEMGVKVDIDLFDKLFSWELSGNSVVNIKCDRSLGLTSNHEMCETPKISVWEIVRSNSPIVLSFQSESVKGEGVYKFPSSVHLKSHAFKCDGRVYFTELYDVKSLNSTGLHYSHDYVPYHGIDNIQKEHFSYNDEEKSSWSPFWNYIKPWTPLLGVSTFTIICILIVLALLCRR